MAHFCQTRHLDKTGGSGPVWHRSPASSIGTPLCGFLWVRIAVGVRHLHVEGELLEWAVGLWWPGQVPCSAHVGSADAVLCLHSITWTWGEQASPVLEGQSCPSTAARALLPSSLQSSKGMIQEVRSIIADTCRSGRRLGGVGRILERPLP